ncbi:uncharacterized protein LOC115577661 [Sparus aurata]|uniref:Uncharacterized LOC115577661 n=1 Tax=Sparus aurata TaxID=8175 RepID=A0A671USF7_SPAAU|nr:uncharacterized protein LOC115577661 [Sparus aurata]
MNLWVSSPFLFVGLVLSVSALTPEECKPLITPLSLTERSTLHKTVNFIMGFTDSDAYNHILKFTESSWMRLSPSASGDHELSVHQENRINGSCFGSMVNTTIEGNTLSSSVGNISSTFQLLPSCDGCLLFNVHSHARDLNKFLRLVNLTADFPEEIRTHAVYLMAEKTTLTDADVEHFKKQASCLGFNREPDFSYDPKHELCKEGEGHTVTLT